MIQKKNLTKFNCNHKKMTIVRTKLLGILMILLFNVIIFLFYSAADSGHKYQRKIRIHLNDSLYQ